MGCGPLKRPECDSGSEETGTGTMHHGNHGSRWVFRHRRPSRVLVLQALGSRGIQHCTVSMDQDWTRLELCNVGTTSLGRW